jgi:hypothetical protein
MIKEVDMTETEWLKSFDIRAMVATLRGKGTERLWRLFNVACAERVVHLMRDPRSIKALTIARLFADGLATRADMHAACANAQAAEFQAQYEEWLDEARANFCWDAAYEGVCKARWAAKVALKCLAPEMGEEPGDDLIAGGEGWWAPDLLREIFGDPFRWTILDPDWLCHNEGAATQLALRIYEGSAFELVPSLGNALEDAGCDDQTLLAHLHSPGPHVRGCWAVDLILGKK